MNYCAKFAIFFCFVNHIGFCDYITLCNNVNLRITINETDNSKVLGINIRNSKQFIFWQLLWIFVILCFLSIIKNISEILMHRVILMGVWGVCQVSPPPPHYCTP